MSPLPSRFSRQLHPNRGFAVSTRFWHVAAGDTSGERSLKDARVKQLRFVLVAPWRDLHTLRLSREGSRHCQLPNDECAGATALANGVTVTMNTASATSTNDPLTICNASADKGVWFTFTPSTSGVVSVRTCGSNFDTVLQVYTGGCGGLNPLPGGCSGDSCGLQSQVTFTATGGTSYLFFVAVQFSEAGDAVSRQRGSAFHASRFTLHVSRFTLTTRDLSRVVTGHVTGWRCKNPYHHWFVTGVTGPDHQEGVYPCRGRHPRPA